MAYANPTATWVSTPLLVPKPGPALFRFTVDIRPINAFTERHQFPMPNIENELTNLGDAKCFALFDLSHSYWQFMLDRRAQPLQSFITPDGIFSPTRVLHGTIHAVTYLQSTLSAHLPASLKNNLLFWLDDILLYDTSPKKLFASTRIFFQFCVKRNLRLHPGKCVLFSTSVRWGGRLISAKGIRYDPARHEVLLNMESPTNGAHLQQFLCALQWVKNGILSFSEIAEPLHAFMELVYAKASKRTKSAVGRVQLVDLGWSERENDAFESCKRALAKQVTLAHRDDQKRLSVYTDASDYFWSGIVTQVPSNDINLPHTDKRHEPLGFLSGRFSRQQLRWSTIEKEAYAVLVTLERMHWLLATPSGFDLFTDHNNLIFLFDPTSVSSDLSLGTVRNVLRWAVRLTLYDYTCFDIPGLINVWADLLTRWSANPTVCRLAQIPPLPSTANGDFVWPTVSELDELQTKYANDRPELLIVKDNLWRNASGAIWIPKEADEMHLRLCIIAHTGPSGHRAADATERTLRTHFFWHTMTADARTFIQSCMHCLSTKGGEKIPRPFGRAVHGLKVNALLQFDYIDLGPGTDGAKYVPILRDEHSNYCWLFPVADTAAEHAARSILDWCAAFGVPDMLMSDGPTHFKNETIRILTKSLKVPHHFTLPYNPCSNGAVERLGKELVRTMRTMVSEFRMDFKEWPDVLPLVQ